VDDTYARVDNHIGRAMSRILPAVDPPEHTEARKLFASFFTMQAVRGTEDSIRSKARRIVDSLDGRTDIDVVRDLSVDLPIQVLGDLLGVPEGDRGRLLTWTDAIFGADDPDYFSSPRDAAPSIFEMFEYGKDAIDARRKEPGTDLLSAVANARLGGEYLDREQVDGTLAMFVGAGNETSRNLITLSLLELWRHPDARQDLVREPALIPAATEELLRFTTPAIHMRRTATEDAEIGGQAIAEGEKVVMFYGAANRDPSMFPDPDRLDIRRPNARRHLAFGSGVHRCIGAPLAQVELRIFLEEFLPRYPNYEITDEPRYLRHNFVHAIKSMPARLA
jgi:cytochrome P450